MQSRATAFVLWLTGLSGAGKTTIGRQLHEAMGGSVGTTAFLDGDLFRTIMGDDLGHDEKDRLENAYRLARMCRYLAVQNINVICCTMSLYPDVWIWNRENIPGYLEVYLRVAREVLIRRDPKGLYQRVAQGQERNLVGMDLPFHEPRSPDLILENNESSQGAISEQVQRIICFLHQRVRI